MALKIGHAVITQKTYFSGLEKSAPWVAGARRRNEEKYMFEPDLSGEFIFFSRAVATAGR